MKIEFAYMNISELVKLEQNARTKLINSAPLAFNKRDGNFALFVPNVWLEKKLGIDGYQEIEVYVDKDADSSSIEFKLKKLVENQKYGKLVSMKDDIDQMRRIQLQIGLVLYCLTLVIGITGIVNIVNTMSMNILLRRREFGLLKALGMTNSQLKGMILKEGIVYGIVSSVFGMLVGALLISVIYYSSRTFLDMELQFEGYKLLMTFFAAILLCTSSTIVPLRRALSMDVVESIQAIE